MMWKYLNDVLILLFDYFTIRDKGTINTKFKGCPSIN
jgi:hypothetical protein